jgi:hypothetical protein
MAGSLEGYAAGSDQSTDAHWAPRNLDLSGPELAVMENDGARRRWRLQIPRSRLAGANMLTCGIPFGASLSEGAVGTATVVIGDCGSQFTLRLNPATASSPFAARLLADYFQAQFVQQRCCSARSREVGPILSVHSRALIPSRWSL